LYLVQLPAQVELWCILGSAASFVLAGLTMVPMHSLHLLFDARIAFGQLGPDEIEHVQRLLEREHMLGSPVALQALGDIFLAGLDASVPQFGQHRAVAFPCDYGAQDLLAGLADDVGDGVSQLNVHLRECLLHVLHAPSLIAHQRRALAVQGT
jgi:hypothetical protein